jgi:sugar transferase (PEP-CTERM/EpsH1 system associated)
MINEAGLLPLETGMSSKQSFGPPSLERPIRVMHILPFLDVDGGMEKVLVDGLLRTDLQRVFPMVCCLEEKGGRAAQLERVGIEIFVESKRSRMDWAFPLRLAKLLKDQRVDIVHTYSGVYRDGCLAARLAGVPFNVHTDQGRFYPDTWKIRLTHRLMTKLRDKVISVSKDLKDYMINEVGIPSEKVVVIYNAVDCNHSHSFTQSDDLRHEFGLINGHPVVGIIGRLVPVKDHSTLLKASVKVFASMPEAKLVIVGDGPLRSELNDTTRELRISDRVLFLGHRNDVPDLLPLMDVVVLCSLHEGSSLTLLEAMADGKAVIATTVGGNPELVEEGITGLLVPPRSPEALADAILTVLHDPTLRLSMGRAARARVRNYFNIEDMVRVHEELYTSLLEQKGFFSPDHQNQ